MIKFALSKPDFASVELIAIRALEMQAKMGNHRRIVRSKIDFVMDISAAHNSVPLDLERLLAADDFNFTHDVFGIEKHLNRETGEIGGCFLPRFAKVQHMEIDR